MSIWTILFVVLLIAWIGGFTVFHVAGALIHSIAGTRVFAGTRHDLFDLAFRNGCTGD
jgi:hypothetical protein